MIDPKIAALPGLACLCCGRELAWSCGDAPDEKGLPPVSGGVNCYTVGNYGSRLIDMGPERLEFAVCDPCLVERRARIVRTEKRETRTWTFEFLPYEPHPLNVDTVECDYPDWNRPTGLARTEEFPEGQRPSWEAMHRRQDEAGVLRVEATEDEVLPS